MGEEEYQNKILIKGAKVHNLKNISVEIPKDKLIVISGISGSGKSSLAFNTLFAEGQRRYIESLSSYARQFLGKIEKPDVESMKGICPAIALEQKSITKNPRSTVGTITEIYDYLKLLYAKIGEIYSPISNKKVCKHQVSDIVNDILKKKDNEICYLLIKIPEKNRNINNISNLLKQGYSRILIEDEIKRIEDITEDEKNLKRKTIFLVIDRIIQDLKDKEIKKRISDSVETAFFEGNGECFLKRNDDLKKFSNKLEKDGMKFKENTVNLFSFNNAYGACKTCKGFGEIIGIDENKVITNKKLSLFEGVVNCWSGKKLSKWKDRFIKESQKHNFPIKKSYTDLSDNEKKLLWEGEGKCKGINQFFEKLSNKRHKIQNRVLIARYSGKTKCYKCNGSRLREESLYVKINQHSIHDITKMSVKNASIFFNNLKLQKKEEKISNRIMQEIKNRLSYMKKVGLSYLTIERASSTLSGGESQRIHLATSLSSSLIGTMYILDEPSIGLHSKDTEQLINVLKDLRDIGNTVIIVEHDEEIIRESDYIIDLGPEAGENGGKIMFKGKIADVFKEEKSLTAQYLNKKIKISIPKSRREWKCSITLKGVSINNIKNMNIKIPLECLTLVTGVSGSGKTSLIKDVLQPSLEKEFYGYTKDEKRFRSSKINTKKYNQIEYINQHPIGRSSRSNPVTYVKAYDEIRTLFSKQELSIVRKYKSGHFSFNVDGGRCSYCKGEGEIIIEMQFMADIHLLCDECKGKRFQEEILEVKIQEKNIADILNLTVDQAIIFFNKIDQKRISNKIQSLQDVGLGYIRLGQASSTLSGGEAQRIKLAFFIGKKNESNKIIFIFDEPTTGLHFHDLKKLVDSFNELINRGHSIVCIEHNLDVIKCADWIIDLGPEGGDKGGKIMFEGIPEDIVKSKKSLTGKYLKRKLKI